MAATHYKRPESVLVVIYTLAGEVLLLRRREPPDFWQSVTGSLYWDETPAQAAQRELAEETGLSGVVIEDCRLQNRYAILPAWRPRYDPAVNENLEHVFRVALPEPCPIVIAPHEHTAFRWLSLDEALRTVSSVTNCAAIAALRQGGFDARPYDSPGEL
jgi:dihydroneopterin triphosphate diphosphatase